jgi:hypothetical protein
VRDWTSSLTDTQHPDWDGVKIIRRIRNLSPPASAAKPREGTGPRDHDAQGKAAPLQAFSSYGFRPIRPENRIRFAGKSRSGQGFSGDVVSGIKK